MATYFSGAMDATYGETFGNRKGSTATTIVVSSQMAAPRAYRIEQEPYYVLPLVNRHERRAQAAKQKKKGK